MGKKIKVNLSDTAETMLQSFDARAQYSLIPKHKFYDAKAVETVKKIDYDFSKSEKDRTMSNGVLARTIVFDELVGDFINHNPDCTVVNIACGLDTRVYRLDSGKLRWYNLDLPEVIELRNQLLGETGRISTIGISALDSSWANKVEVQGAVLFIIEGLTMYLTAEEVGTLLCIIRDNFDRAMVMMECSSPDLKSQNHADQREGDRRQGCQRQSMRARAIRLTMGRVRCPIPSGIMWARGGSMSSILSTIRFLISPMEWAVASPGGAWRNRSATRSRRPSRM